MLRDQRRSQIRQGSNHPLNLLQNHQTPLSVNSSNRMCLRKRLLQLQIKRHHVSLRVRIPRWTIFQISLALLISQRTINRLQTQVVTQYRHQNSH